MKNVKKLLALVLALVMSLSLATIGANAVLDDEGDGDVENLVVSNTTTLNSTATYDSITVKNGGDLVIGKNAKVTTGNFTAEAGSSVTFIRSGADALKATGEVSIQTADVVGNNADASSFDASTATKVDVADAAKTAVKTVANDATDAKIETGNNTPTDPTEEEEKWAITWDANKVTEGFESFTVVANWKDEDGNAKSKTVNNGDKVVDGAKLTVTFSEKEGYTVGAAIGTTAISSGTPIAAAIAANTTITLNVMDQSKNTVQSNDYVSGQWVVAPQEDGTFKLRFALDKVPEWAGKSTTKVTFDYTITNVLTEAVMGKAAGSVELAPVVGSTVEFTLSDNDTLGGSGAAKVTLAGSGYTGAAMLSDDYNYTVAISNVAVDYVAVNYVNKATKADITADLKNATEEVQVGAAADSDITFDYATNDSTHTVAYAAKQATVNDVLASGKGTATNGTGAATGYRRFSESGAFDNDSSSGVVVGTSAITVTLDLSALRTKYTAKIATTSQTAAAVSTLGYRQGTFTSDNSSKTVKLGVGTAAGTTQDVYGNVGEVSLIVTVGAAALGASVDNALAVTVEGTDGSKNVIFVLNNTGTEFTKNVAVTKDVEFSITEVEAVALPKVAGITVAHAAGSTGDPTKFNAGDTVSIKFSEKVKLAGNGTDEITFTTGNTNSTYKLSDDGITVVVTLGGDDAAKDCVIAIAASKIASTTTGAFVAAGTVATLDQDAYPTFTTP